MKKAERGGTYFTNYDKKVPREGNGSEKSRSFCEIVSRNLGPVLCGERISGQKKYERACFEKLSSFGTANRAGAVQFCETMVQPSRAGSGSVETRLRARELKALWRLAADGCLGKTLDAEFFQRGLAEAMRILEQREIL